MERIGREAVIQAYECC